MSKVTESLNWKERTITDDKGSYKHRYSRESRVYSREAETPSGGKEGPWS
jgi:hypothetical protein